MSNPTNPYISKIAFHEHQEMELWSGCGKPWIYQYFQGFQGHDMCLSIVPKSRRTGSYHMGIKSPTLTPRPTGPLIYEVFRFSVWFQWKSTARLPKHMINLQIATNSRTLTTFSPENKNSACPKSIPIPRPPSHPLQSFRVSARSNPTIPEVGQASALLPQSFAEPHGSSHCGHWQNCSSALWRKARTWNTWNMGEAIHFVATDFLLIGILII